jgi:mycothiol synthase
MKAETSVRLRSATWDDVAAVDDLFNSESRRLHGTADSTPADVRHFWELDRLQLERDVVLAEDESGTVVGYGDIWVDGDTVDRVWFDVRGEPADRLLAELERRVAARADEEPAFVRVDTTAVDERVRSALHDVGYRVVRLHFRMIAELHEPPPAAAWPAGLTVRTFDRARDERAVYEVQEETFADVWEHTPSPYDEWCQWMLGAGHDPSLWFVAGEGDEIAGIALCRLHPRGAPEMGWVSVLGVRRPWRRRGIGLALLQEVFGEFHRRGWRRVGLGVDGESETGAVALYRRAGMGVDRRFETWERKP